MASLGYSANCNLAIFVLVALHANVVNIPRSRSQCLTAMTVFGPLRLRHVNDSVPMTALVLDKITRSPFLRFLFLEYHNIAIFSKTKKTKVRKIKKRLYSDLVALVSGKIHDN